MPTARCPDCGTSVPLGQRQVGDRLPCVTCEVELAVAGLNPPEVAIAGTSADPSARKKSRAPARGKRS